MFYQKVNSWLKYVKGRNEMDHPNWLINIVTNHEEVSKKEAIELLICLCSQRVVCWS